MRNLESEEKHRGTLILADEDDDDTLPCKGMQGLKTTAVVGAKKCFCHLWNDWERRWNKQKIRNAREQNS